LFVRTVFHFYDSTTIYRKIFFVSKYQWVQIDLSAGIPLKQQLSYYRNKLDFPFESRTNRAATGRTALPIKESKWEGVPEVLLPGPPAAAGIHSVARLAQPRSVRVMSGREALNYAARASASLSLALMGFEP
jgi:hypothetical protein